jgi:hypothetical protein
MENTDFSEEISDKFKKFNERVASELIEIKKTIAPEETQFPNFGFNFETSDKCFNLKGDSTITIGNKGFKITYYRTDNTHNPTLISYVLFKNVMSISSIYDANHIEIICSTVEYPTKIECKVIKVKDKETINKVYELLCKNYISEKDRMIDC